MIERILLASDGPGAWTAAAAVADLVASAQEAVEVEVLHVNEVEYKTPPDGSGSTDPFPERRELVDDLVADLRRRGIAASAESVQGCSTTSPTTSSTRLRPLAPGSSP